jgi:hypothetical protein
MKRSKKTKWVRDAAVRALDGMTRASYGVTITPKVDEQFEQTSTTQWLLRV